MCYPHFNTLLGDFILVMLGNYCLITEQNEGQIATEEFCQTIVEVIEIQSDFRLGKYFSLGKRTEKNRKISNNNSYVSSVR